MDLAAHFRVIAQNWLRILLISIGIAILVFAASTVQSKKYQAKAAARSSCPAARRPAARPSPQASAYLAQNYAKYADTPGVVRNTIKTSKLDLTPRRRRPSRISASQVGDLGFVEVKATGPSKAEAERLTRFAASSLIDTIGVAADPGQVRRPPADPDARARTCSSSSPRSRPARPSAAGIQGQIDALNDAEVDIRARKDDKLADHLRRGRLRQPDLAEAAARRVARLHRLARRRGRAHGARALRRRPLLARPRTPPTSPGSPGLPVLAKIPKGSGLELVEAFRVLRTNLMVLEGAGKPRTLAVVSSNQSAGKTFTAVHLAQSAAGLDEKVVIVDADLRKPSVHERLGVPRAPGLSAVLQGNDLATMLRKLPDTPFLRVLTSGAPVQDASAVLGARPFRHVLDSLRAVRLVVVDTPPAAMFADAMAVASQCDATIFVLDVKTSPPPPGAPDARSARAGRRQPRRRRRQPHRLPAALVATTTTSNSEPPRPPARCAVDRSAEWRLRPESAGHSRAGLGAVEALVDDRCRGRRAARRRAPRRPPGPFTASRCTVPR